MNIIGRFGQTLKKTYRFLINMLINDFQSYVLNLFHATEIHNDLGASPTSIKRLRMRIVKRALTPDAEKKLRSEIAWILRFSQTSMKFYLPTILDYKTDENDTYYTMRYYNMPNLRKIILENMSTSYFIEKRIEFLLKLQHNNFYQLKYSSPPDANYFETVFNQKFESRLTMAVEMDDRLGELIEAQVLTVNGHQLIGPKVLFRRISRTEDIVARLTPERLFISHGDLHSNNILCGLSTFTLKLLDCRGLSPDGTPYFDVAYDIGKLYHDFNGLYSLIEKHLFTISSDLRSQITYRFNDIKCRVTFRKLYDYTRKMVVTEYAEFGDVNYRADLIEAHLFLTMIVFHLRDFNEGLMCFTTGVELLNRWVKNYHPEIYNELIKGMTETSSSTQES